MSTAKPGLSSLPHLEDVGRAILELQQLLTVKQNPNSTEEELEATAPVVAALRDALVQHLVKAAAIAKKGPAATSGMLPAAQQHEYIAAAMGLLRAARELFPDPLEFSSALIACGNKAWWVRFTDQMQPLEKTDGECLLEMQGEDDSTMSGLFFDSNKWQNRDHGEGNNEDDPQEDSDDDDDGGILSRFAAAEAVADQWWEAVLVSVCGVQSISECYPADILTTHETVLLSAIATMCLYVLGPPVTSSGEAVAGSVQKRAVAMVTSLPPADGAGVVRAVARLVVRHLLLLSTRRRKASTGKHSSSVSSAAFVEHQGTLALHRWFSLLAAITKFLEHSSSSSGGSGGGASSARLQETTSPATPPASFLLPLVGLREVFSRRDLLEAAAISCNAINWIRKIFSAPSYFSPSAIGSSIGEGGAFSSRRTISCDLDIFVASLLHCSLRASRIDTAASEHSERTECHSANFFLHIVASKLCSTAGAGGGGSSSENVDRTSSAISTTTTTTGVSSSGGIDAFGELPHLHLSRGVLQLVRLVLLHDGIPYPPPRPTEGFGIYSRFCPCCVHLCMEVRRSVSVTGLVLPLSDSDIEPWANMVWRDGPNSFTGSATSFREDSPARRRAMPSVHPTVFVASSSGEEEEEESAHAIQDASVTAASGINSSSAVKRTPFPSAASQQRGGSSRRRQIRENASVTQAELPRLFSPVQRAAAVFRLALIDGGCAVSSASTSNISTSSSSGGGGGGGSGSGGPEPGEVARVPAVIWPCAADGLLESLEHDHHIDNATWLVVASAATVAACAAMLRYPCDLALSRLVRVMQCRARREEQQQQQQQQQEQQQQKKKKSGESKQQQQQQRRILSGLLEELTFSQKHRPRTSELFDNVNPLVFAEWEKSFANCCDEALRQPAASTVWQQQHHQNPIRRSPHRGQHHQHDQDDEDEKKRKHKKSAASAPAPRPTRESSLSHRNNGTAVVVWLDSSMSSSFLFGTDAAQEQERGVSSSSSSSSVAAGKKQQQQQKRHRRSPERGDGTAGASKKKEGGEDDDDDVEEYEDGDHHYQHEQEPEHPWVPIWVTLLPEGSAIAADRSRECISPLLSACCGIICADTALSCPLRPNDLVFFTPACPEEEAAAVAASGGAQQPEVLFPRVVLRAWRQVPAATALVPNIAIRRCEGTRRSFSLTLTSGEGGYSPLSLHCASASNTDSSSVSSWPMAQWLAAMRHLGRSGALASSSSSSSSSSAFSSSGSVFTSTSTRQTHHQQMNLEQKQTAAVFHMFGPGFADAASRGPLRSFWSSLRDVAVPFLAGSAPLYWAISRPVSSSSREESAAMALWPPPYLTLGPNFGVTTEMDAWRGTVSLEVADAFLENN